MNTREDLATATTLAGVTNVAPYYRQSLRPGAGFVRIGPRTRAANGFGYVQAWEVWIAIPDDIAAAEKWLDEHLTAITEAAETAMVVTTVTPSELVLGSTTVSGVVIAGSIPA